MPCDSRLAYGRKHFFKWCQLSGPPWVSLYLPSQTLRHRYSIWFMVAQRQHSFGISSHNNLLWSFISISILNHIVILKMEPSISCMTDTLEQSLFGFLICAVAVFLFCHLKKKKKTKTFRIISLTSSFFI